MAIFRRIRVVLTGSAVVGGGVSTFHAATDDDALFRGALEKLYLQLRDNLPTTLTVTIPNTGELVEVETGVIQDTWTVASPAIVIPGLDPGGYAAGVGARIVWNTNGRTGNKRVRGSTFIVPYGAGAYENNGTLAPSVVTRLNTGAAEVLTDLGETFTIWTRPINGAGGKGSAVVSYTVPDKVSWLRSRRT